MAVFGGSDLDSTLGRIDRHDAKRVAEVVIGPWTHEDLHGAPRWSRWEPPS
jgi:hypothetical protein